jgi:ABC-type sugar transport system ATPase subunit
MADLTLSSVKKAYGNLNILHGIDLDIKSGEFIVFVGPSGCGKSTLLRTIAGLEDITGGTLEIAGEKVNDVPPSKRGIAMVFQSYALYPHMTVYDNMAFGMKIARESKTEIDRRVRQAAEILQLTKYLERLPKALSGGQRQRVAIGRAIVRNPKVFLFDEPLSNLDAALRVATRIEIAKLKESMPNTTMIYVTHDQVEAMTLADRIVVLKDGRIEQVGSPMELYLHPGNLFVAQFIGSPAMNILPAKIEKAGSPTAVRISDSGTIAHVPVTTQADAAGTAASFGVRPEDLRITDDRDGGALFEGVVDYVEQLGEVQLVYVEIGRANEPLVAKLPGNAEIKRGAVVRLTASPGDLHIFDSDGRSFARDRTAVKAA